MTVIAFPFAGGNKYSFDFLIPFLEEKVSFKVVEYSGRGAKIKEPLVDTLEGIVDNIFPEVLEIISSEEPYVLYGHSMGGMVAFLISHKLQKMKKRMPETLIISGKKAPSYEKYDKVWSYPSDEFWKELVSLGGVPKEVLEVAALKVFFEPIIRADFKAIEEFKYQRNGVLEIPISVLYGDDEIENDNDFNSWEKESTKKVTCFSFQGDHFFIHTHAAHVAKHLLKGFD